jgi:hypothetical protein
MHRVALAVALIMIATACVAQSGSSGVAPFGQNVTAMAMQEPGTTQAGAAASAGEKTIRGCIGIGSPRGFVINTTEGRTVPLFTDRDLSAFVGKQVEIRTRWQRKGISLGEQSTEGSAGTAGTSENPATSSGPTNTQQFAGSISMSFTGKVMGPCEQKK